jgi:VWFA-related protein
LRVSQIYGMLTVMRTNGLGYRSLLLVVVLAAAPIQAAGQERATGQGDPDGSPLLEEIRVRVVTVPVAARDRWGRPVTDLSADELTVREGGREYRIESLEPLVSAGRSDGPRSSARLITDLDGASVHVATSTPGHRLLIVVDTVNGPPMALDRALNALGRFVREGLKPGYQVALFLYDGRLMQLMPFQDDRAKLESTIAQIPSIMQARPRLTPDALMRQFFHKLDMCRDFGGEREQFERCLDASASEFAAELLLRGSSFVAGLEMIVDYLGGLEGHNSLLMVGGSVSLNPAREIAEAVRANYGRLDHIDSIERALQTDEELRPRLNEVMRRAIQSRTTISFLDRTPPPSDFSARQDRLLEPGFRPMMTAFQMGQQDLTEIASLTGGSFVATTRVDAGLQQSLRSLESTYELSFYLPDEEPLTERRLKRIAIRSRRSGVRISPSGIGREESGQQEKAGTVQGSVDIDGPVERTIDGQNVTVIPIRVSLDPATLGYEETRDQAVAQFSVHVILRSAQGDPLADLYRFVTHTYTLALWRGKDIEQPVFTVFAELEPGAYVIETVVTVPRREAKGMLRQQFRVVDSPGPGPKTSG